MANLTHVSSLKLAAVVKESDYGVIAFYSREDDKEVSKYNQSISAILNAPDFRIFCEKMDTVYHFNRDSMNLAIHILVSESGRSPGNRLLYILVTLLSYPHDGTKGFLRSLCSSFKAKIPDLEKYNLDELNTDTSDIFIQLFKHFDIVVSERVEPFDLQALDARMRKKESIHDKIMRQEVRTQASHQKEVNQTRRYWFYGFLLIALIVLVILLGVL